MHLSKFQASLVLLSLLAPVLQSPPTMAQEAEPAAEQNVATDDQTLPAYDVWDEYNQPFSSKRWIDGKPFLVDFWATWCGPCRFTLPELERIHRDYDGRLSVYGVSVDSGMGGGFRARNFAKEGGVSYTIFHDLKAEGRKATGVRALPVLFLYDGEGRLVNDWWGEPDFDEVRELIDSVAEPAPPEASETEPGAESDQATESTGAGRR